MTARGMAAVLSRSLLAGMELRVGRMTRGEQLPLSRTRKLEAAAGGAFSLPSLRVSNISGSAVCDDGLGTCTHQLVKSFVYVLSSTWTNNSSATFVLWNHVIPQSLHAMSSNGLDDVRYPTAAVLLPYPAVMCDSVGQRFSIKSELSGAGVRQYAD